MCEEKEIGFGRARLVLENGVQMMWIVSICVVYYNKEVDKFEVVLRYEFLMGCFNIGLVYYRILHRRINL